MYLMLIKEKKMLKKYLKLIIFLIILNGCASTQASKRNSNQGDLIAGNGNSSSIEKNLSKLPALNIESSSEQIYNSTQDLVFSELESHEFVILQLASVACGPCREEAQSIRQKIVELGLEESISHHVGFVDISDPNAIGNDFVETKFDQFIEASGENNISYLSTGAFNSSSGFYTYIVSEEQFKRFSHNEITDTRVIFEYINNQ